MPRPNISLNVGGGLEYTNLTANTPPNYSVVRAYSMSETTSGVARHKPQGWIPPTSYTVRSIYRKGCVGSYSSVLPGLSHDFGFKYTGVVGQVDNSGPMNFQLICNNAMGEGAPSEINNLANSALIQARGNLKDMSVDLGTAFGERRQTANLVADTANRLVKTVRHLRHGEIRNAMRDLGISNKRGAPRGSNWTNNWLELQYGWKPMLSDVYGACDALSKRGRDDWMVTAKGSAHTVVYGSDFAYPSKDSASAQSYKCTARGELGAFVRIDASPSGSGFISSLSSVGVLNPLNVAWELVPYSFVVDWFLPVGSWLSSLDATMGYQIRGVSISKRFKAHWDIVGLSGGTTSNGYKVTNTSYGSKDVFTLERTTSTSVPVPHFPGFKDPRSYGHMANALALLSQVFGRR